MLSPRFPEVPITASARKVCRVSVSKYPANSDYHPQAAAIAFGFSVAARFTCPFDMRGRLVPRDLPARSPEDGCSIPY